MGDFEALLLAAPADPGLVPGAVGAMMDRAVDLVTAGGSAAYYRRAVLCVASLRAACLAHGESERFNAFLASRVKAPFAAAGSPHGEVWDLVVAEGINLITCDEDSAVDVAPEAAVAFVAADEAPAPPPAPASLYAALFRPL